MTSSDITSVTSHYITPIVPIPKLVQDQDSKPVRPLLLSYQYSNIEGEVLQPTPMFPVDGSAFNMEEERVKGGRGEEGGGGGGEGRGRGRGEGGGGEKRLFPWLRLSVNDLHILKTTERYVS